MVKDIVIKYGGSFTVRPNIILVADDVQAYRVVLTTPFALDNHIFKVTATRADGAVIEDSGSVQDSTATYLLKNNMHGVPGDLILRLTLCSPDGTILTDKELYLTVASANGQPDISGDDRIPILDNLLLTAANTAQYAEYAKTQGAYAASQGEYAREQGEYATQCGDHALQSAVTPKNLKYVYCDGIDDHLKLQTAIDNVTDTNIPTIIYPVGPCVLKVAAKGVPESAYDPMDLVVLKDNMTLDGRYGTITLDFSDPYTQPANATGFVTVFRLKENGCITNCTFTTQGDNVCYHRLVSCTTYADAGMTWSSNTSFIGNRLSWMTAKLDTLNMSAYAYIYLKDGVMRDNTLDNIDANDCGVLINAAGTSIINNRFWGVSCGGKMIDCGGCLTGNHFKNIDGPTTGASLINVSGSLVAVNLNRFNGVSIDGGCIINASSRTQIINNIIANLALAGNGDIGDVTGISSGGFSAISGNQIFYKAGKYTKIPLSCTGAYCIVTGNLVNYTTIGEISGTGTVQDNNVATGQITE